MKTALAQWEICGIDCGLVNIRHNYSNYLVQDFFLCVILHVLLPFMNKIMKIYTMDRKKKIRPQWLIFLFCFFLLHSTSKVFSFYSKLLRHSFIDKAQISERIFVPNNYVNQFVLMIELIIINPFIDRLPIFIVRNYTKRNLILFYWPPS